MKLKGKHVLVAGLGISGGGVGVAQYLIKEGAQVTVTDLKTKEELKSSLKELDSLPIKYVLGKHRRADFENADLVIKNPGVPDGSPFIKAAQKNKVPVLMDINLFWQQCLSKKIIGVTGTKGKTTTAYLIKEILVKSGLKTVLAGNLGISFLTVLPKIDQETWVVLELSSWQLEGLKREKSSPHISVITNIFPDHLNRYPTMNSYVAAKKVIFAYQGKNDYLFLNRNNSWTRRLEKKAPGKVFLFSADDVPENWRSKIKLTGEHNLVNIAAAIGVGKTLKVSDKVIKEAVTNFPGLRHRLELFASIKKTNFYNDSAATNPTAAQAAINSLHQPFVWILGGSDKNLDFGQLIKSAQRQKYLKAIVLLEGSATKKIRAQIQKKLPKIKTSKTFNNFNEAVKEAYHLSNGQAAVLLSPAAASFGMFKNEFDRGDQFKQIVNDLVKEEKLHH